jgi:hypothetical protein
LGAAHGVHDEPHVAGLVSSAQAEPHVWWPLLQSNPHVLIVQVAEPYVGAGQALPHAPQFV